MFLIEPKSKLYKYNNRLILNPDKELEFLCSI